MSHYHINAVYLDKEGREGVAGKYPHPAITDKDDALNVAYYWVRYMRSVYNATSGNGARFTVAVKDGSDVTTGYESFAPDGSGVRATIELCQPGGTVGALAQRISADYGDGSIIESDDGYVVSIDPVAALVLEHLGIGYFWLFNNQNKRTWEGCSWPHF